jgi:hypothetical protein
MFKCPPSLETPSALTQTGFYSRLYIQPGGEENVVFELMANSAAFFQTAVALPS